jgi:hypothetical protein
MASERVSPDHYDERFGQQQPLQSRLVDSDSDSELVVIGPTDIYEANRDNILPESPATVENIRAWLKPTKYTGEGSEYEKNLNSHLPGTGGWIFDSPSYQQWKCSDKHGILWIRGMFSYQI